MRAAAAPAFSRCLFLTLLTGILFTSVVRANPPTNVIWSHKPTQEMKWYSMTEAGTILVGTENSVYSLDPESGETTWRRDDLKGINQYETHELSGTPVLLVADNSGTFAKKTMLFAVDLLTGKTIWQTEKLRGATVEVAPNYEKGMLVFLTITDNARAKDKPDITALNLATGDLIWESEFTENVDLYGIEHGSKYFPKFDLSGAQPPVFDTDSVYFTYAGLHRFSLADGKLIWKAPYDVTEGKIKQGNSQAVIDGDTIYTSAKGQVRAYDKATGALKWTSKDFGGALAQMLSNGDVLYGRLGGTFYDFGKREYVTKKPLGVVALDKKTGAAIWSYEKAENSITNMTFLPDLNTILIADAKNLIGLDTTNTGKIKESFKVKLEFKYSLGAAATVAKVGRFALGGLSALGSKGGDTTDEPVAMYRQENGTVVVRGAQHLLAFNPQAHQIVWATKYAAPGVAGWKKIAMTAITIAAATMSQGQAMSYASQGYYSSANNANSNFIGVMSSYEQYMSKRFTASKTSGNFTYVLTDLKEDKEKGAGIVGVNMLTGQGERQVMFKDKDPDYEVDEATGRIFNLRNSKELNAYLIR